MNLCGWDWIVEPGSELPIETRRYVFLDESGDLDFTAASSRYFIICTASITNFLCGHELMELGREITWEGHGPVTTFHAKNDPAARRDRVLQLIARNDVRFDVTYFEKRKVNPALQDKHAFYAHACYAHLEYVLPKVTRGTDPVMITAATIHLNKKRLASMHAVQKAVDDCCRNQVSRSRVMDASAEPGLQLADYGAWAFQRKLEKGLESDFMKIRHNYASKVDIYRNCHEHYY